MGIESWDRLFREKVRASRMMESIRVCTDRNSFRAQIYRKKEAQIEIQAVAKIQYPIKSQISYANDGPIAHKRGKGVVWMFW